MSNDKPIPYGRQSIDARDVEAVVECLRGDWLTQGPHVEDFERALCQHTGATHAVAVANGTAALHLACLALGVGPGDAGVTSAITFVASANAIRYAGGQAHFADVDPTTGLIDEASLTSVVDDLMKAGRAPRLLVPVDLAGQPVDRRFVRRVAERCGAKVLEDAAHSLGASYTVEGVPHRVGDGGFADAAILSFHPVKHITTGEGGAILTNDAGLAAALRELRSHGIHKDPKRLQRQPDDPFCGPWYYEQSSLGFNYRITDLQCALGLTQLSRLDGFLDRRREIAARYRQALQEDVFLGRLAPLRELPDRSNAYHLFVVQVGNETLSLEALARQRKALYFFLQQRAIYPQVHYVPVPWQPNHGGDGLAALLERYPGAARYYAASLSLPMYPVLTAAEQERVIAALADWAHLP